MGSEKLFVSIAGDEPAVFGTVTDEVYRMREFLKQKGGTTVAMEATGVYGLYAYAVLEAAGLEVIVVNGRYVRNLPGRKTDLSDCQWLATLHAHGLLRGGFVPPAEIRRLQDYQRLRADHITEAGSQVQKMQQALERMNIKFHDVISDLTGVSGMKVIKAILAGERQPERLLELCDKQIQKKKSERVLESLHGVWAPEPCLLWGRRYRFGSFTRSSWPSATGKSRRCSKSWRVRRRHQRPIRPRMARPKRKHPKRQVKTRRRLMICTRCWFASVAVGMPRPCRGLRTISGSNCWPRPGRI